MEYNYFLDIALAIPLVWGIVRGIMTGFVRSLSVFIGIILGIIVSNIFAADLAEYISEWFTFTPNQCVSFSYVLIFLAVILVVLFITKLIEKFLHLTMLNWLNRLLGAIFAFCRWAVILSFFIMLIEYANDQYEFLSSDIKNKSYLYNPIKRVVPTIMPYVKI
jgi:membrane protein required for colicin V production